jgi:tetratricopeptide (TPR) repeat protein
MINKIERNSQNAVQWDNVKGSAYFYRAFRFLNLIWEYGKAYDDNTSNTDLGIVLRLGSDFNEPSVRADVKTSYERIISDATQAVRYLPNSPQHVMRPSKAAAYGLLARTYLSMRKYDLAYKYADSALQIKNDLLDYNSNQVDGTSQTPFQLFNKEIIFYSAQSGNHWPKSPFIALIDSTLYHTYSVNDLRRGVFFYENSGYHSFKGNYNVDAFYALYSGITTDEMYLIRAETNARADRLSEALNDLNTLLVKRWITGTFTSITATNQQNALSIILLERRKELVMRGLRWIDIKRLNKEGENITLKRSVDQNYILAPNDNKYALPLPRDIIDLTGIPQNPGW